MMRFVVALLVSVAWLQASNVSAFLEGEFQSTKDVKEKLASIGYEVLAVYAPVEGGEAIVFTDEALKKEAGKEKRAYAAVLRAFVDKKEGRLTFANPVYFGRAFMQDDYDAAVFQAELKKIRRAFPSLRPSHDALDEEDLGEYHFMMGMPYYEDTIEFVRQPCKRSLERLRRYNGGKNVLFVVTLTPKSYLVGFDLGQETQRFVDKIGRANAALLPWTLAVEHGKVTTLHPKYYIALSYPSLSMSDFMGIASVPGAIEDEIAAAFQ